MKKPARTILYSVGALAVGVFIALQLVPVERTNPPVTSELNWDVPETRALAERACFDCHSNETKWPAYAYLAPVSWMVADHVQEGREELNFSEWDRQRNKDRLAREIEREIQRGTMPLENYTPLHPEADLTEAEKQMLIDGLRASINNSN